MDDHLVTALEKGSRIKVSKDHLVKLAGNYYVDGQYHPAELIDFKPEVPDVWDGWDSPDCEITNTTDFLPGWEDWESWDWG